MTNTLLSDTMRMSRERRAQVAVRFDANTIANLDTVVAVLSRQWGATATRSDVVREAVAFYLAKRGYKR